MAEKRRKELSEDQAHFIALRMHPEWRKQLERDTLPEEIVGEDGELMNPHAHITVHAIVERQLAADEPKGVVAVARELERLGLSRHEVRHAIGMAVATQIWTISKELRPFDTESYMAELAEIVESYKRKTP